MLDHARRGGLREPGGLVASEIELLGDFAGELPAGALEPREPLGEHLRLLLGELPPLGLELPGLAGGRGALARELRLEAPQPLEGLLGVVFRALAPFPGFAEDLLRTLQNGFGNALLARDGERAAAAGEARMEPVVRTSGRLVELHRCTERVGARGREGLDAGEVRGRESPAPAFEVRLEKRHGEGAAFLRVRRSTDLVDQRERSGPGPGQDPGERLHRRRKGRAVREDRLGIADLGANRAKDRQARAGLRGDRDAALGEHREEPGRLQDDGFSAALGPETTRRCFSGGSSKSRGTAARPSRVSPSTRRRRPS